MKSNFTLIDKTRPWVIVKFIHKDNKEHCFYSTVNKMSGSRSSAFDNSAPSIDDSMTWIKSVLRDIKANSQIISLEGTISNNLLNK